MTRVFFVGLLRFCFVRCSTGGLSLPPSSPSWMMDLYTSVSRITKKFYWANIEPCTVHKAISRIKSRSIESDGYSTRVLRTALPVIPSVIVHIFNFSLANDIYPRTWRSALACSIPKMKFPTEVKHYRSVSIPYQKPWNVWSLNRLQFLRRFTIYWVVINLCIQKEPRRQP